MPVFRFWLSCAAILGLIVTPGVFAAEEIWPQGLQCERQNAPSPLVLADEGRAEADIVLLSDGELIESAADWLSGFVERSGGAALSAGGAERLKAGGRHVVAVVGEEAPLLRRLVAAGKVEIEPRVGSQGFVIQRVSDPQAGELLVCWSPAEIGCRYGLIEILRSLAVEGRSVRCPLGRAVERPRFPMRICYVNFAEHLQNAYNPNVLFDVPVNRWTPKEWERFIDMVSAFRYNIFEFWLVPTLFSPEALEGGEIQARFAETINHVIAYGKGRGVAVHPIQAVNTVGQRWHYHCPNDPREHAEIVALWDHWSRAMKGNEMIGLFPGDPGGCTRNGCTPQTYVDLCLELSKVVRKNNPGVRIEVNTWGEPFGGWGVPLWSGKRDRAESSMRYFLSKLGEFPPGTFTSINMGFSPDCLPTSHGGDGRPFAEEAARTVPVLTWDYSVTEGEGTVSPRCRVRRIFQRRREELVLGCYSGGICYTMTPKLNCLNIFCCAEAYWNPALEPEAVLADYGRLIFGDELAAIGPLMEEFEVVPDWGYYPPFPYSPQRLEESMARLIPLLEKVDPAAEPRLPLAPTTAEYRESLLFFAELFRKLATVAVSLEEIQGLVKASGELRTDREDPISLDELEELLARPADFPQKAALGKLAAQLRQLDVRALMKSYSDTVYGIYEAIPHPVDPRAQGATSTLFRRFRCELAAHHAPSVLEQGLRATGKPYVLIPLGQPSGERGWTLHGWPVAGEDDGVTWRASFGEPGLITREDFQDEGYRWLVLRLTEGPKGGRKTVAINGRVVAEFVRTGPPVEEKKEWWVTRCYPIPERLLKNGKIEIRFTDPGVAVAEVVLSAEPVPDTK
ncbi:MAG: hypothetical protein ABIK89_10510 [Planctomycetota bacterium]